MRRLGGVILILAMLTGCGHWPFGEDRAELVEAELRQVEGCEQLGSLSEILNTDKIITPRARRQMDKRVEARAKALGGTHLVWVYRTDQAVAARVFGCSD